MQIADFIEKLGVVLEEADEALYWLEILGEVGCAKANRLVPLLKEADELISILVSSLNTAKSATPAKRPPQSAIY